MKWGRKLTHDGRARQQEPRACILDTQLVLSRFQQDAFKSFGLFAGPISVCPKGSWLRCMKA